MTDRTGNLQGASQPEMMLRHLSGELSAEGVRALDGELRRSQEVRREFAGFLVQQVMLAELSKSTAGARTRARGRVRARTRLVWTSVAAAVLVAVAAVVWMMHRPTGPRYPSPVVSGPVTVQGGGPAGRGTTLSTAEGSGTVTLGGYCRIKMQPHSRLKIEGVEKDEGIRLEQGKVACSVQRAQGEFAVRTEVGTVSVSGTEFSVELVEKGEGPMLKKGALAMVVAVAMGSVQVSVGGGPGTVTLWPGQSQVFAADVQTGTVVTGVVTAKQPGRNTSRIAVRADGEEESQWYDARWIGGMPNEGGGLDKAMLAKIAQVHKGDRVKLAWVEEVDGTIHRRVLEQLEVIAGGGTE